VLIHLLSRTGDWRLGEIGAHFGVGTSGAAGASRRGGAHLRAYRRLADRLREVQQWAKVKRTDLTPPPPTDLTPPPPPLAVALTSGRTGALPTDSGEGGSKRK
jgi:hypothetical protein